MNPAAIGGFPMRTFAKIQAASVRIPAQAYTTLFCILGGAWLSLQALAPMAGGVV